MGAQKWEFNLAFQSLNSVYQRRPEAFELPALPKLDVAEYVRSAGTQLTSMLTQPNLQAFTTEMTLTFAPTLVRKTSFLGSLQEEFGEMYKDTVNQRIKLLMTDMRRHILQYSQSLSTPAQEIQSDMAAVRNDSKLQAFIAAQTALFGVKIPDQSSLIAALIRQAEERRPAFPRSEWQGDIESLYRKVEEKACAALQRAQRLQRLKARIEKLTNKEAQITDDSWIALAPGSQKPSPEPFQAQPTTSYLKYHPQPPFHPPPTAKIPAFHSANPSTSQVSMQVSDLTYALPRLPKPSSPRQKDRLSPTLSPVESAQSSLAEFGDADLDLP